MPSDSECMAITGFCSTRAASALMERHIDHTLPDNDVTGSCLSGRRFASLPILGTVTAGSCSPANEALADTMSLDAYSMTNKEATSILRVNDDSMIEAGILPGDLLLVERGANPRDGNIVIAHVDRAWTMPYFRQRGRQVFLEAVNRASKPMHPQAERPIAAVLRAVVWKYT